MLARRTDNEEEDGIMVFVDAGEQSLPSQRYDEMASTILGEVGLASSDLMGSFGAWQYDVQLPELSPTDEGALRLLVWSQAPANIEQFGWVGCAVMLAREYNHFWAFNTELFRNDWEEFVAELKNARQFKLDIMPSHVHTTGTGRLSWEISQDGQAVDFTVCRPDGPVLSAALRTDVNDEEWRCSIEEHHGHFFERHVHALERALSAVGAHTPELDKMMVGRNELEAALLRGEIERLTERLVEVEEQIRCQIESA